MYQKRSKIKFQSNKATFWNSQIIFWVMCLHLNACMYKRNNVRGTFWFRRLIEKLPLSVTEHLFSNFSNFLETLYFFPKGSFKNFLLGHLPKKACKESAPTYNRRPNAGSHLLVSSQGGIWSTKMWHWAVSCTQTCAHTCGWHTPYAHTSTCVCALIL